MAIHQTKKNTDLEKRFLRISQQLAGKQVIQTPKAESGSGKFSFSANPSYTQKSQVIESDFVYLQKSLVKITFLTALAIGSQVLLYLLTTNHILKIGS